MCRRLILVLVPGCWRVAVKGRGDDWKGQDSAQHIGPISPITPIEPVAPEDIQRGQSSRFAKADPIRAAAYRRSREKRAGQFSALKSSTRTIYAAAPC